MCGPDFTRFPGFAWSPKLYEHEAEIKVTVLDTETKQTGEKLSCRSESPRACQATNHWRLLLAHPLVALFSFPACSDGSKYLVAFQRKGETTVHRTGSNSCRTSTTNNLYVAEMRPDSEYTLHSEITNPSGVQKVRKYSFRTGLVDVTFGRFNVIVPRNDDASKSEPVILFSSTWPVVAFDGQRHGRERARYMRGGRNVTRILPGGDVLAFNSGVTRSGG